METMAHGGNLLLLQESYPDLPKEILDFSANINPWGPPKEVMEDLSQSLASLVRTYPDYSYRQLKACLGDYLGLSPDLLLVGNGAAELFDLFAFLLPKRVVIIQPTFSEYQRFSLKYHASIDSYFLDPAKDFQLDLKDLEAWLKTYYHKDKSPFTLYWCNPNNPTGTYLPGEEMRSILEKLEEWQSYLVVDESFMDFVKEGSSLLGYVANSPHLILVSSLTKFYAIPGLRLGWSATSNQELLRRAKDCQVPWSVNALAESFGKRLAELEGYRHEVNRAMEEERAYLMQALAGLPQIKIFDSRANFLLLKTSRVSLYRDLLSRGLVLRSCQAFPGLDQSYLRLGIRNHQDNQSLIQGMRLALEGAHGV